MMPAAAPKRKHGAAFKPQRPGKVNGTNAHKPGKKSNASRGEASSGEDDDNDDDDGEDDEEDEEEDAASDDEAMSSDTSSSPTQSAAPSTAPLKNLDTNPPPSIPPKLLAKILHHNLAANTTTKDMRIDKDAMSTLGRYIETFTREAIARAAFERGAVNEERERKGEKVGAGEGFLEVSLLCYEHQSEVGGG